MSRLLIEVEQMMRDYPDTEAHVKRLLYMENAYKKLGLTQGSR